jgi:hypothetical protein
MGFLSKMFGSSASGTPEERFWSWFAENSSRIGPAIDAGMEAMIDDQASPEARSLNRLFDEIHSQMKLVDKGLVFTFGPVEEGRREFIVSADGVKSVFPAVQRLVAAAPAFPDWKIIAFRPAGATDYTVEMPGCRLGGDDIWIHARHGERLVDVTLYERGLSPENHESLFQAAFLLMDNALGEYVVETRIGGVAIEPLPVDPVAYGYRPFRELPELVEKLIG